MRSYWSRLHFNRQLLKVLFFKVYDYDGFRSVQKEHHNLDSNDDDT